MEPTPSAWAHTTYLRRENNLTHAAKKYVIVRCSGKNSCDPFRAPRFGCGRLSCACPFSPQKLKRTFCPAYWNVWREQC